ncbi:hypothetical protein OKA04_14450 [Luteolibacter flavescens]|uniref:SCP domain-containing protein n=1 Tax=Luteolibacter flavescens TaxID=1859460 RepID=A0ABT3FRT0_9BACT|nr:CAP domain-containing protein [Luteolibacter flavescens]MCW1885936.1 hypothetical protein [Luteolibacter flavescens]
MTCLLSLAGGAMAAVPPEGIVFVPSAKEFETYRLIRDHPDQKRVQMVLDPRLCLAARKHAEDTQRRKFFAHMNPDQVNSNQRVLNEGYPLPANYTPSSNFVESMRGSGVDTPADSVAAWRASSSHAPHVFGQTAFYAGQVVFGVGHAPPSGHQYATYVFLSAPLPTGEQGSPLQILRPMVEVRSGSVALTQLPAQAIVEVWKAGPSLNNFTFDRTAVVGSNQRIPVGTATGNSGFFRLTYYRP